MRNTRRRGNVLSFFLGILFGLIITVGGIVGAGFYVYKKAKVSAVVKIQVGDEYKEMSLEQFITEIKNTFSNTEELTIDKIGNLIPGFSNLLPEEGISFGTLGKIDVKKLTSIPIKQISKKFTEAVKITATLSSLESDFGASLPDMPFIRGGLEGLEVWSYVEATELEGETYVLKDDYVEKEELYAKDDLGAYVLAVEGGEVKAEYQGKPLWYRTNGLLGINVIDAIGALADSLDFETMTLADLEDKFGISLEGEDGYHPVLEKMMTKKVSELGDMEGLFDDLMLTDVIAVGETDTYLKAICYKRDTDGDMLGRYVDGDTEIEVKVNASGIPLDSAYGNTALPFVGVKISGIEQQINNVMLKDFLGEQYDETDKIMSALGETPLGKVGEKISSLTLVDVMEMDNRTMRALAYQKGDNGSGEYWFIAKDIGGETTYVNPTQYEIRADGKFYAIATGVVLDGYQPIPAAISDVSEQVEHLLVRDCVELDDQTPHLLYEIVDVPVKEIGHALHSLDMRKILGDEHLMGYIRASKQASRVGEKTGVAVGDWYILHSFEYYYSANGVDYSLATLDQINAKQNLYTFDTTYMHYVKASKQAAVDGEVEGVSAGEWYILRDHEYWYSTDGETFTKATPQQILAKENLYVYDLVTFWHFVFHQEDEHGNEIIITLDNIGESVDHIASIFSEAKIGLLYDREIFLLEKAPLEVVRNATLHEVIEAATIMMGI